MTVVADAPVRTRPGRLGHVPGLDGLRGAAVLAVTLFHFPTARFVPGGWVGVDVFFVLSGFLITALLLERRGEPLRAFYRRRLRRLGPAAAAFVACWAVLALVFGRQPWFHDRTDLAHIPPVTPGWVLATVLAGASLTYNWWLLAGAPLRPIGHLWSLAVEEQFYLVWPALIALLGGFRRRLAAVAVAGFAVSALVPFLVWHAPNASTRIFFGTDTRMQGLFAGALVAILHASGALGALPRRVVVRTGAAGGLLLLGVALILPDGSLLRALGGLTVFALAGAALVAALAIGGSFRPLTWAPMRWLGRRSYALYLWHAPVAMWTRGLGWPAGIAGIAASVVLAELSWRLIERRFTAAR